MIERASQGPFGHYLRVSLGYGAFTLTDGALRMLVLLHLHAVGCRAFEIASILAVYEALGVVTNLFAGRLGQRLGLKPLIASGQLLQAGALGGLAMLGDAPELLGLLVTQGVSGVAKDLLKTGAKSSVKRLVPSEGGGLLLRWVAWLTGSKNVLKGVGFFLGGALLSALGFSAACWTLAGIVVLSAAIALPGMPRLSAAPEVGPGSTPTGGLSRVRWLAAARLFLFGSRDVWFAVALPLYLHTALHWSYEAVGAYLAVWVIGYGFVQASAPKWLGGQAGGDGLRLARYTASLIAPLGGLAAALHFELQPAWSVAIGLGLYGCLFAMCSALHSYLIVAYAEEAQVAKRVGFYYSANAGGRLLGTLGSGALYQWQGGGAAGLLACLAGSGGCVLLALCFGGPLRRHDPEASPVRL